MFRLSSRAALLCAAGLTFVLASPHGAGASPVDISSDASLSANVVADLGSGTGANHDRQRATDSADLAKHQVNAHAEATLNTITTTGSIVADLLARADGFDLTGTASTHLPDDNAFQANTTAVNNTLVPFTVSDGFLAHISYVIDIDSMVRDDQKVTIELRRQGESVSMFHHVYNKSTTAALDELGPGSYNLLAVTGSLSTAKGTMGETGSADYHVMVTTSAGSIDPPPAAIPLPAAAVPGAITLGLTLLGSRLRRR
jgi:hypothetical protein